MKAPREVAQSPGCEAAELFELLWTALVDLVGSAATATLIRRSLKRAATRAPELGGIVINRERFEYRYVLPPEWKDLATEKTLNSVRELARELRPLLEELTGPVVLRRLRAIPDLERCRVFPPENEP